jgi:hypothetical protein
MLDFIFYFLCLYQFLFFIMIALDNFLILTWTTVISFLHDHAMKIMYYSFILLLKIRNPKIKSFKI